jgi:hypothetical protein
VLSLGHSWSVDTGAVFLANRIELYLFWSADHCYLLYCLTISLMEFYQQCIFIYNSNAFCVGNFSSHVWAQNLRSIMFMLPTSLCSSDCKSQVRPKLRAHKHTVHDPNSIGIAGIFNSSNHHFSLRHCYREPKPRMSNLLLPSTCVLSCWGDRSSYNVRGSISWKRRQK